MKTCRDCTEPLGSRNTSGLCGRCYRRNRRHEERAINPGKRSRFQRDRLEDLEWMAATGETFEGAAKRLGITQPGLEKWINLHAPDLWERFRRNEREWVA